MYTKFFEQKSDKKEDKEKGIQFVSNIYSVLSRDPSISNEMKQKILIGSLFYANLSAKEIQEDIVNRYAPSNNC
ncbi:MULTISPECIES: hypothetical protein [Legionella]|uniref:Uncharacterized protein n=1 Tax=Legionella resiliens TaxID=2905958 RepID=A0ABS8WXB8_9GAMM|nr:MULTISPECIES: hypothetical protein [unclassified Legionella]MCE0721974.1 hypothetical protein [Legionella sp. 9fVS26]MCE3531128.1 hypothetical protein [Legionella sp. 8cVS16]QLZ70716.1 hypothetical protein FOLKNPGA_03533 [Legionella sp. PC1000]